METNGYLHPHPTLDQIIFNLTEHLKELVGESDHKQMISTYHSKSEVGRLSISLIFSCLPHVIPLGPADLLT